MTKQEYILDHFLDDLSSKIADDLREGTSRAADGKWQGKPRQFSKWSIAWVLGFLEAGLDKPEDLHLFKTMGKIWRTEKNQRRRVDDNYPFTGVGFFMATPNPDSTIYTTFYAGAWWKTL